MTFDIASARLWNHAKLPGEQFPAVESFIWALWDADRERVAPHLETLVADILSCLEAANVQLNGPVPLERAVGPRQDSTAIVEVAYPIALIVEGGLKYHRRWSRDAIFTQAFRDDLEKLVHRVSFAWCQVLAGDIDDLLEGFPD
jgi:hypothetical protein